MGGIDALVFPPGVGEHASQVAAILNVAGSGKFSSDRTIAEYAAGIQAPTRPMLSGKALKHCPPALVRSHSFFRSLPLLLELALRWFAVDLAEDRSLEVGDVA